MSIFVFEDVVKVFVIEFKRQDIQQHKSLVRNGKKTLINRVLDVLKDQLLNSVEVKALQDNGDAANDATKVCESGQEVMDDDTAIIIFGIHLAGVVMVVKVLTSLVIVGIGEV